MQFGNARDTIKSIICQIITPAPGMKQVLDKPGSCGQYENYQRPEGFPVGKQSDNDASGKDDVLLTVKAVFSQIFRNRK